MQVAGTAGLYDRLGMRYDAGTNDRGTMATGAKAGSGAHRPGGCGVDGGGDDVKRDSKPEDSMTERIKALSNRQVRLNQWQKDYAAVHGWQLRKRGRPRKAAK